MDKRISDFCELIEKEIAANSYKGDIFDWPIETDFPVWLYEFEYHKAKLIAALMAKDEKQKTEYAVDLAVYLLAIVNRDATAFTLQRSVTLTNTIPLP